MAKPYIQYAKQILNGLHYGATWTPGTPLRLGQIGTFEDGIFVPRGHLSSIGIAFEIDKDSSPTAYTYVSAGGVSLRFKAKGEPASPFKSLLDGEAGVAISFGRENAVLFSARECYEHRIANSLALQEELTRRLNQGMWREDWAVVTHLVESTSATIILSASRNTTVELEADASLGQGPVKLGDLSAGVAISYSDSMNQLIIADQGLTPLFHSLRLKRSFWSGLPKPIHNKAGLSEPRAADGTRELTPEAFQRVDFDPGSLQEPKDDEPKEAEDAI